MVTFYHTQSHSSDWLFLLDREMDGFYLGVLLRLEIVLACLSKFFPQSLQKSLMDYFFEVT